MRLVVVLHSDWLAPDQRQVCAHVNTVPDSLYVFIPCLIETHEAYALAFSINIE